MRMEAGTSPSPTGKERSAASLGRPGTPEDVARGVLMLASPLAEYVNGAAVVIDGGASAGPVGLRVVDP